MKQTITRRELFRQTGRAALVTASAGPFFHFGGAAETRRPNFLCLLTDDQSLPQLEMGVDVFATREARSWARP